MIRRPLVAGAMALAAGLLVGRWLDPPATPALLLLALAALGVPAAQLRQKLFWRNAALVLGLFAAGLLRIHAIVAPALPANHVSHWVHGGRMEMEGIVEESPARYRDGGGILIVRLTKIAPQKDRWTRATGKLKVLISRNLPPVAKNDAVRFATEIDYIASPRTPGVDGRDWTAAGERLYVLGRVFDGDRLDKINPGDHRSFDFLEAIRTRIRQRADAEPDNRGWLAQAMVLGEQSLIDSNIQAAYSLLGVGHLLVISGTHITAIAGMLFTLFWYLFSRFPAFGLRFNVPRLAALIASPAVVGYTVVAGGATTIWRASVMFLIMLFSIFLGRRRDPLNSLAAAFILTLLCFPEALWQVGFQLSFASVWGMIHWRRLPTLILKQRADLDRLTATPWVDRLRTGLVSSFFLSAAAYLATVPICLWHFGEISPVALVANLAAIPIYGLFVVPLCLLGALFVFIHPTVAHWLWTAAWYAADQVYGMGLLFERLGCRMWFLGRPTWLEMDAFFLLIFTVPLLGDRRARAAALVALGLLIAIPPLQSRYREQRQELTFTMLDVGQGMSILVRGPEGKTILVDGGVEPRGQTVRSFLSANRLRRIDLLIFTHPHPDHFRGLLPLLEKIPIGEIWILPLTRAYRDTGPYLLALDQARARGLPVVERRADPTPIALGPLTLEILNPPPEAPPHWDLNDRSLAFRIRWGGRSALILADMAQEAETALLATGRDLRAEVVQVPHHGSLTSLAPDLIERLRAGDALLPVGFQNPYTLPNPEVVAQWTAAGVRLWRTDRDGAIACRTTGGPWRCDRIGPPPSNPLLAGK